EWNRTGGGEQDDPMLRTGMLVWRGAIRVFATDGLHPSLYQRHPEGLKEIEIADGRWLVLTVHSGSGSDVAVSFIYPYGIMAVMVALNSRGYLLLPGIVDLHGDGFERHLSPRPTAPFEKRRALASAAAELASNGVTTAWLAQSWSWEGGFRSGQATTALLAALGAVRGSLLPDMRVQIRLETHLIEAHADVLAAVAQHSVDYVVFNNHLPEALEMAAQKPDRFAQWALSTQRSTDQMLAIVRAADAQGADVPAALTRLAAQFAALGVAMGSHDDGSADVRRAYRDMGAHICEFPTTFVAAQSAKDAGEPVLMGAPNVVRGGSQSGNISAQALIAAGLCDALVSDYYYPALGLA
ncbi:MAG: alpha-D-ribose 1-methylphosphonate 5-triphosphate diphosphatase, partial [Cypionkella sp.]